MRQRQGGEKGATRASETSNNTGPDEREGEKETKRKQLITSVLVPLLDAPARETGRSCETGLTSRMTERTTRVPLDWTPLRCEGLTTLGIEVVGRPALRPYLRLLRDDILKKGGVRAEVKEGRSTRSDQAGFCSGRLARGKQALEDGAQAGHQHAAASSHLGKNSLHSNIFYRRKRIGTITALYPAR